MKIVETLAEFLDQTPKIIELAEEFGLTHVRLWLSYDKVNNDDFELKLLVAEKEGVEEYAPAFQAALFDEFKCQVNIVLESPLEEITHYVYFMDITNRKAIEERFKRPLNEIRIADFERENRYEIKMERYRLLLERLREKATDDKTKMPSSPVHTDHQTQGNKNMAFLLTEVSGTLFSDRKASQPEQAPLRKKPRLTEASSKEQSNNVLATTSSNDHPAVAQ